MFGHLVIFWEMTSVKNFSATSCIYGVSNLIYYKVTKIGNIVWTTEALLCILVIVHPIFLQLIHSSVMVSCIPSEKKCLSSSKMVMEKMANEHTRWTNPFQQLQICQICRQFQMIPCGYCQVPQNPLCLGKKTTWFSCSEQYQVSKIQLYTESIKTFISFLLTEAEISIIHS